jgi:hypothetical protein
MGMGRVVAAGAAAALFTIALITALTGVSQLTILTTLGGLIALSVAILALVNDPPRR